MTTAVATRPDHPIIAAIDGRMGEIASILPAGMDDKRFRKVVVQAMLRTPALWECTPVSIITAITEAAEVGIEPTGVLGKGWLIPYRGEAKFIPGWRGFVDLLWRADRILLSVDVVRIGDEFSYRRGTDAYLHHVPDLSDPEREASDDNITAAYVIARFPDGREDFEVMSRVALDKIKAASLEKARDKSKAIWNLHPGEMMKKTPVRRLAKRMPLSPAVQAMLGRDEEIDFDTPVERTADPKRDALRERIASRTAALRGEPTDPEESEGAVMDGAAVPGSQPAEASHGTSAGGSPAGDPWMRRLHAVGTERGMDHDALHDWAVQHFRVQSLKDLSGPQRATFMELVERMPVIDTPAGDDARSVAPASAQSEADSPQSPAAPAPTDDEILAAAGEGAEIVPPRKGTPEYDALPSGVERAAATRYWSARDAEGEQATLAEALGGVGSDR